MDQNRKPGVPPTKDISDLKARLGLKRPDGAAPGPGAPAAAARPQAQPGGFPQQPGRAPAPMGGPQAAPAAAPQAAPAGMNPYAKMKAPTGRAANPTAYVANDSSWPA